MTVISARLKGRQAGQTRPMVYTSLAGSLPHAMVKANSIHPLIQDYDDPLQLSGEGECKNYFFTVL